MLDHNWRIVVYSGVCRMFWGRSGVLRAVMMIIGVISIVISTLTSLVTNIIAGVKGISLTL